MTTVDTKTELGTNSEVGVLWSVIVHRPNLAHERLSPTNVHELLVDDVISARRARQEHDAFVDLMRSREVEVCSCTTFSRRRSRERKAASGSSPAGSGRRR
jgi:arginine deiminase